MRRRGVLAGLLLVCAGIGALLWALWGGDGELVAEPRLAGTESPPPSDPSAATTGGASDAQPSGADEGGADVGAAGAAGGDGEAIDPEGDAWVQVTGQVLDPDAGALVTNAQVRVEVIERVLRSDWSDAAVPMGASVATAVATALTDAEGRFALRAPAGRWLAVVAHAEGYGFARRVVPPDEGDPIVVLNLEAVPLAELLVVDEQGRPVAGAELLIYDVDQHPGAPMARYETGATGVVTLPRTTQSQVRVRKQGYGDVWWDGDDWPERLVLRPGYAVGGITVDASGAPVAGTVILLGGDFGPTRSRITGPDGRFRFEGLADANGWDGSCRLEVRHAELVPPGNVHAPLGDEAIRIVLGRRGVVAGRVTWDDGAPAAGAEVRWYDQRTTTDAGGRYELTGVAPGEADLWAIVGTAHGGTVKVSLPDGGRVADADITVPRTKPTPKSAPASIKSWARLQVLGPDGDPVPVRFLGRGVRVGGATTVAGQNGVHELVLSARIGTEAEVEVQPYAAPPQRGGTPNPPVEVKHPELLPTTVRFVTGGNERPPQVQVRLETGVVVSFEPRLPDGSAPPNGTWCEVHVWGRPMRKPPGRTEWPVGGDAPVFGLRAGATYRLLFKAQGYGSRRFESWQAPQGSGVVPIEIGGGLAVTGRVALQAGPVEPHSVVVTLTPFESELDAGFGVAPVSEVVVGEDGRFAIRGVAAGTYVLVADLNDEAECVRVIALADEPVLDVGTLTLAPRPRIPGRVVDASGGGLGGVWVRPVLNAVWSEGAPSRTDGSFDVPVPRALAGHLLVSKRGYGTRVVPVTAGELGPLKVVLAPGGTIRCEIVGPMRRSGSVQVATESGALTWQPDGMDVVRDKDSRVRDRRVWILPNLGPEPVRVIAHLDDREASQLVTVRPGETVEITLTPK